MLHAYMQMCRNANKHEHRLVDCTHHAPSTHRSFYTVATVSLSAGCHSTERCTDLVRSHTSLGQGWGASEGNDPISKPKDPPASYPTGSQPETPSCWAPISTSRWVALLHTQQQLLFTAPKITEQPMAGQEGKLSKQTDPYIAGERRTAKRKNKEEQRQNIKKGP